MDRGVWQATVHGVTGVGHNLVTNPPPTTITNRFHLLTLTSSVLRALFMPYDVVRWHHLRFMQGVPRWGGVSGITPGRKWQSCQALESFLFTTPPSPRPESGGHSGKGHSPLAAREESGSSKRQHLSWALWCFYGHSWGCDFQAGLETAISTHHVLTASFSVAEAQDGWGVQLRRQRWSRAEVLRHTNPEAFGGDPPPPNGQTQAIRRTSGWSSA